VAFVWNGHGYRSVFREPKKARKGCENKNRLLPIGVFCNNHDFGTKATP
jgi:hypothetical protein